MLEFDFRIIPFDRNRQLTMLYIINLASINGYLSSFVQ